CWCWWGRMRRAAGRPDGLRRLIVLQPMQRSGVKPMKSIGKYLRWMMMLCVIGLTIGCAVMAGGSHCDIYRPIWWDSPEELAATPDGIVRQVVTHNETWRAVCP